MNKQIIIGNLVQDPSFRAGGDGNGVCNFVVAVNRSYDKEKADFFKVSAWGKLGENCMNFLDKGKKVCVWGAISAEAYKTEGGEARATLCLRADHVEFLSRKED